MGSEIVGGKRGAEKKTPGTASYVGEGAAALGTGGTPQKAGKKKKTAEKKKSHNQRTPVLGRTTSRTGKIRESMKSAKQRARKKKNGGGLQDPLSGKKSMVPKGKKETEQYKHSTRWRGKTDKILKERVHRTREEPRGPKKTNKRRKANEPKMRKLQELGEENRKRKKKKKKKKKKKTDSEITIKEFLLAGIEGKSCGLDKGKGWQKLRQRRNEEGSKIVNNWTRQGGRTM